MIKTFVVSEYHRKQETKNDDLHLRGIQETFNTLFMPVLPKYIGSYTDFINSYCKVKVFFLVGSVCHIRFLTMRFGISSN